MDPAEVLRDQERLLAMEYGASHPPASLGGEDLDCDDVRDARHWVRVYTELVEFVRGLIEGQSSAPAGGGGVEPDCAPAALRAMTLQRRVLELHLAFWTAQLRRLGGDEDAPGGELDGEQSP